MSYACVAIVFAAVFIVNTLAAAIMSGVFSTGAKKAALTAQAQDRRGCQAEQPLVLGSKVGVSPHLDAGTRAGFWLWKSLCPPWLGDEHDKRKCWQQVLRDDNFFS